jgi:hypothetical protein
MVDPLRELLVGYACGLRRMVHPTRDLADRFQLQPLVEPHPSHR